MVKAKVFLERYPTLAFYALVFIISWGGILLVVGGSAAMPGTMEQVKTLMPFVLLVPTILLGLSLSSPEFLPRVLTTSDRATLLLFGIGWGLVGGGLLEELGWTWFAVPTLRRHNGILGTGLIVGLLWGVWHSLVAFWAISGTASGGISPAIFLPALVFYV